MKAIDSKGKEFNIGDIVVNSMFDAIYGDKITLFTYKIIAINNHNIALQIYYDNKHGALLEEWEPDFRWTKLYN